MDLAEIRNCQGEIMRSIRGCSFVGIGRKKDCDSTFAPNTKDLMSAGPYCVKWSRNASVYEQIKNSWE